MMKNFHLFLRWGIFAVQNNIKTICMMNNSLTALWIEKFYQLENMNMEQCNVYSVIIFFNSF